MHDLKTTSNDEFAALRAAFELVRQAVFIVDGEDQLIVDANPAAHRAAAVALGALVGRPWQSIVARVPHATRYAIGTEGRRFVAIAHDVQPENADVGLMPRDTLTGLANRAALGARMRDVDESSAARLAILFIDLDGFKRINDTWGHLAGDRVLQAIADRLSQSVRPSDLVVRYGGDEFVVLVEGLRRPRNLDRLARRIRRAIEVPIMLGPTRVTISASVGIARGSAGLTTVESLVSEADRAMYRAKALARKAAVLSLGVVPTDLTGERFVKPRRALPT